MGDGEAGGARMLVWVPIVHTQEDMGSLRDVVRRQFVARHGQARWDEHVRAVEATWVEIHRRLDALGLDPARTRIYQDGLPVCGQEEAIVRDLAARAAATTGCWSTSWTEAPGSPEPNRPSCWWRNISSLSA